MNVLLIEGHPTTAQDMTIGLTNSGAEVDVANDGVKGDFKARTGAYDVIILDVVQPKVDGVSLLKAWREQGLTTRVIVVTALQSIADKVRCLELGADDYLTRPFEWAELTARLRALLRRGSQVKTPLLRVGDLEIDAGSRTVRRAGRDILLTPREFALLQFLVRHCGKVVSRTLIWRYLYDESGENMSNVIDVYIRYLRKKIDHGFAQPLILTRRGQGYLFRGEGVMMEAAS
jgi:DNA-binding response OmpR family regulator